MVHRSFWYRELNSQILDPESPPMTNKPGAVDFSNGSFKKGLLTEMILTEVERERDCVAKSILAT